jgi:dGTPase
MNGAGREFQDKLTHGEWKDFTHFDGNANAFRVLTNQFNGKRPGGFALTYSSLASIVKYPYQSVLAEKPKFGFFQSEKDDYLKISGELGISENHEKAGSFCRHPLVYLVEAADDICYQIMDLEDAYKLGILSYQQVSELFMSFYNRSTDQKQIGSIEQTLKRVTDRNEQIGYLRAGVIGKLIHTGMDVFMGNLNEIMEGTFRKSLMDGLPETQATAMKAVREISFSKVYSHRSVVEIEIAGYKIIGTLLEEFVGAVMNQTNMYSRKILSLLPDQYKTDIDSEYAKIQSVVDFVSGMTDIFALDLYRKIKGISLPGVV